MTTEIKHLSEIIDDALRPIRAAYWQHIHDLAEEIVKEYDSHAKEKADAST